MPSVIVMVFRCLDSFPHSSSVVLVAAMPICRAQLMCALLEMEYSFWNMAFPKLIRFGPADSNFMAVLEGAWPAVQRVH